MIATRTHLRLRGLTCLDRSVATSRDQRKRASLRSLVDAAEADARMGGMGVAVEVRITTDPADAPADCRDDSSGAGDSGDTGDTGGET